MVGIKPNILMWPPGIAPRRPDKAINNTGRRDEPGLMPAKELALSLPKRNWRTISWREGSAGRLSSRFARVRVRVGRNKAKPETISEEWLLIEWPQGEKAPTRYWLSTLPADIDFQRMVDITKLRWRVESDYHDLKQEIGLGHYEGRGWRGFHHHATLCIAAYGFLIAERAAIPPSGPQSAVFGPTSGLPEGYRPRGSPRAA